jgi:fumarate reductase flavoprotein subunit
MKNIEADTVVVAAGLSGLAASVTAAEHGARVVALEKAKTTGGAANMGMGPLGIGSRLQRERMITITPGEAFRKHMNYTHWRVDARLVRDYYWKAGSTIDWLEDMGVEFVNVGPAFGAPENIRYYAASEATGHLVKPEGGGLPGPGAARTMVKALTNKANALGVEILLETPAKKILKKDGRIVGVIAESASGEVIQANAKAVIIASGGFGDNPEWIKKYTGFEYGKDLFSFRIPGNVGDGIKMAWEAGAGKSDMMMEMIYLMPDSMNHFTLELAFRQPGLWVNVLGERFINEETIMNTTYTGNAIALQPKRQVFATMDEAAVQYYKKHGSDVHTYMPLGDLWSFFDGALKQAIDEGYAHVFTADSLGELAAKTGIDAKTLATTVEEYNRCCERNFDELFEKDRRYLMPLKGPKFYACRYFPGAYGSLGGIKINYRTEVVTNDNQVIPGLYASGTDACSIFGDSYPFILPGNTMAFALNSGRIAGENAAAYARTMEDS